MEMEEKLLTKRDLAAFFQTGVDAARRLCEKHGVLPINIGTLLSLFLCNTLDLLHKSGVQCADMCQIHAGCVPQRVP